MHYVIISFENQFVVFLRVAVLHRFYCIIISYSPPTDIIWASMQKPVFDSSAKVQTSLCIWVVWSVPLLFAYWKVSYLNLLRVKFHFLASLCSWAGWFESQFIRNPDRFSHVMAHVILICHILSCDTNHLGMVSSLHWQMTWCHQMSNIMSYNIVVLYIFFILCDIMLLLVLLSDVTYHLKVAHSMVMS